MCYRCCTRLPVVRGAAVEPCHQVAVGGAGGGYFVVAVLEVLPLVEELLFEWATCSRRVLILSIRVRPASRKTWPDLWLSGVFHGDSNAVRKFLPGLRAAI